MRFLVDVNAGGRLSEWLAAQGHDVRQVAGRDPGMLDEEVLNWAASEARIIVTVDKDFGEMAIAQGKLHCGIWKVWLLGLNWCRSPRRGWKEAHGL